MPQPNHRQARLECQILYVKSVEIGAGATRSYATGIPFKHGIHQLPFCGPQSANKATRRGKFHSLSVSRALRFTFGEVKKMKLFSVATTPHAHTTNWPLKNLRYANRWHHNTNDAHWRSNCGVTRTTRQSRSISTYTDGLEICLAREKSRFTTA